MLHPFLEAEGPIAVAHRGGDVPAGGENTLAAFEHAVGLGYRYLETDVRATRDGVLVCLHDPTLDRISDGTGPIGEWAWADLRKVRVAGAEPILRFDDLLDAFPPGTRVVVDAKSDDAVPPLVAAIRRHRAQDRVCVGSFSDERLERVRAALGAGVCTSMSPAEARALRRASLRLRRLGSVAHAAACVQVPLYHRGVRVVDRRFLSAAHRLGLPVHVWTVNEPRRMHELLDLGVDGIVSDAVASLRAVLVERGAWHSWGGDAQHA